MIIMLNSYKHETSRGISLETTEHMVVYGEDDKRTAMAKTVGLPVAISAHLILQGKIKATGVRIPISKEVYEPILDVLAEEGIKFHTRTKEIPGLVL
mmetsp:Transcript_29211/g.32439  ORF Transcript_29211/g.32439 Transcript_29211/m.32439 type:complete len:97 (+) Transcript_29211:1-291(+)